MTAVSVVRAISLLGLFFLVGGLFGVFGLQPVRFMAEGLLATRTLVAEMTQTRPRGLSLIAHSGNGVTVHDPGKASDGLTLVQGLLPGGPQVRLVDMTGHEVHRWEVNFFEAWKDPNHIEPVENIPKSMLNYHTQGFAIRRDGSLLAVIGDKGAVNTDRCGRVLWTVDRMVHHSVTPAASGGYWLPSHRPVSQADHALLAPTMSREKVTEAIIGGWHNPVNTVLKVDNLGRPLKEFTILDAIQDAGLESVLHDGWAKKPTDPTHLNDIELVTPALAERIPQVEPGDLLVSLRNLHMLAILDQDDGSLKWHRRGPWVRQHDPDITPDGRIVVFNNRAPLGGSVFDGSQIVAYDPATDRTQLLHPKGTDDAFRTAIMGSHQRLPNGNRLIVESTKGRVFEVTADGEVVWSYVLPYDDTHASLIEDAKRVPRDFFSVSDWACDKPGN